MKQVTCEVRSGYKMAQKKQIRATCFCFTFLYFYLLEKC